MASGALRAGGLIIFRQIQGEFQYLLLQTSYGQHHWTPPKGHLDPGEDFRQAAVRETEEEAGLYLHHLNILDFQHKLEYQTNRGHKEVIYWLAELKDINTPVKLSDEHQDFKWLVLKDAKAVAGFRDMQVTLDLVEDYLQHL